MSHADRNPHPKSLCCGSLLGFMTPLSIQSQMLTHWHDVRSEQEQTHLACLPDGSLGLYHPWIASNCPLFIHTQAV